MVSQYDISLFKAIEEEVGQQLAEYEDLKETEVLALLKDVNLAKRMAKMRMEEFEDKNEASQRSNTRRGTEEKEKSKVNRQLEKQAHKAKEQEQRQQQGKRKSMDSNTNSSSSGSSNGDKKAKR